MRYYVRAYPMHESEVAAIGAETAAGGIEAEVHDGMIEGVAEEEAIARLAAQGIVVRAIAQVPDAAAPVRTRIPSARASATGSLTAPWSAINWAGTSARLLFSVLL